MIHPYKLDYSTPLGELWGFSGLTILLELSKSSQHSGWQVPRRRRGSTWWWKIENHWSFQVRWPNQDIGPCDFSGTTSNRGPSECEPKVGYHQCISPECLHIGVISTALGPSDKCTKYELYILLEMNKLKWIWTRKQCITDNWFILPRHRWYDMTWDRDKTWSLNKMTLGHSVVQDGISN